jgi:NTE family protein
MTTDGAPADAVQPVRSIPGDETAGPPQGVALCLSGGGYRAMLFHVGVVWRLGDAGWLRRLDRISSVSGGSIAAGVLALAWPRLDPAGGGTPGALDAAFVQPIRELARRTIDASSVIVGALTPDTVSERVAKAYRRHVFGDATLQDLPDKPRFVMNATSVQSGALWRFSKPYMADYRVGRVERPDVALADAVAASSAFPPVLSPFELDLRGFDWITEQGNDLTEGEYRERAVLSDGGVYDNLGLETAWKRCSTVLVSDAGGHMSAEPDPDHDWGRHLFRVLKVVDNQVRDLRKRQAIDAFKAGTKDGAYWGVRTDIADYGLHDALPCPHEATLALAALPTRLARTDDRTQERLINWGYAVCDAALRAHVDPTVAAPAGFPYPDAGVGAA